MLPHCKSNPLDLKSEIASVDKQIDLIQSERGGVSPPSEPPTNFIATSY